MTDVIEHRKEIEHAADIALASGEVVHLGPLGIIVVPDVVAIEAAANGQATPDTVRLSRGDGRICFLFRTAGGGA